MAAMTDRLDRAIGKFRQVDRRAHIDREQRKAGEDEAEQRNAAPLIPAFNRLRLGPQEFVLRRSGVVTVISGQFPNPSDEVDSGGLYGVFRLNLVAA